MVDVEENCDLKCLCLLIGKVQVLSFLL